MLPPSPFTRSEALDDGVTERQWRSLSVEGFVREVVPGFFVDASLPDTLELRFAIIKRAITTEHVVIARRSASWLHGVDVLDYRGFPTTPRIETLTRERRNRPRIQVVQAHVADDLLPSDVAEIDGLRVTTPLRTAADVARRVGRTAAGQSLE